MTSFRRLQRLRELFIKEISAIIRGTLKDPRLNFVTVCDVELSNDLRHGKVYISVIGDTEAKTKVVEILNNAKGIVRSTLFRSLRLKYIPELTFSMDDSLERAASISKLLKQISEGEDQK